MTRGSMDMRHKPQAYLCVQGNSIAHVFPVFLIIIPSIPTGIPTTDLFQTFVGVCVGKQVKQFTHSRREENVGMCSKLPMIGGSSATFKPSLLVLFGPYTKRLLCKFEKIKSECCEKERRK